MTAELQLEQIINQNKIILKRLDKDELDYLIKIFGTRMSGTEVLRFMGKSPKSRKSLDAWDKKYKIIDPTAKGDRIFITEKVYELKNRLGK